MPLVMLRPSRPNPFRRTIQRDGKSVQLVFLPGQPLNLPEADIKRLVKDIGHALVPARKDGKGKIRAIYDDVIGVVEEKKPVRKKRTKE